MADNSPHIGAWQSISTDDDKPHIGAWQQHDEEDEGGATIPIFYHHYNKNIRT